MKDTLQHCTWPKALHPACLAFLLVISVALIGGGFLAWGAGHAMAAPFTDKELVLNGEFTNFESGWLLIGDYSATKSNIGKAKIIHLLPVYH